MGGPGEDNEKTNKQHGSRDCNDDDDKTANAQRHQPFITNLRDRPKTSELLSTS
jgi:hypothetical protein